MARPLYIEAANALREISDTDMERIAYWVRTRYANQVNGGGSGSIFSGGAGTAIGSMSDTSNTEAINTRTRNYTPGADYPAYPATYGGQETDATYNWNQNRNTVTDPTVGILDADGYLIHDGATGLRMINAAADIQTEILDVALAQMRTGDEVGTYRVATASPGTGWVDKGTWFTDSTYSAGTTTYKLWLRTSATAVGTAPTQNLCKGDANGVIGNGVVITEAGGFVNNILLPYFTNWVRANSTLNYTVNTTVSGINRGSMADTRQDAAANDQWFTAPTYYSRTKPSGGKITKSTEFLSLN